MSSLFWNSLKLGSMALGVSLLLAPEAKANDSLDFLSRADFADDMALEQVTSVSQLSDVQPTDWAFQALQSLVERYGCIAGYPDGTFRGNRALTRYEFAAGLNACLAKVEELIGTAGGDLATKEDLQTLQRLQEEFAAELAVLRGRVDALEARTSELEANQFSTTTKLSGEVLFNFAGANNPEFDGSDTDDNQITFSHRTRLNFDTSFSGRDRLRVRLQTGNTPRYFGDETSQTRFGFEAQNNNTFVIDKLYYQFPIASGLMGYVGALYDVDDVHDPLNPFLASDGSGSVSRFGRRDPLIYRGPAGAGLGLSYKAGRFGAALSYFGGGDAQSPDLGDGFFNGTMNATVTANYKITDSWTLGAAYSYRYFSSGDTDLGGGTASGFGRRPFGSVNPTNSHNVGIQTNARISDGFAIGGWASVAFADDTRSGRNANLFNWAVNLAFPDLFKEGNLGGIIVGQPPYVYDGDGVADEEDPSWHIEALYRIALNDNIAVTPAVFVVTNPENNDGNDAAVVGVIRTRFQF